MPKIKTGPHATTQGLVTVTKVERGRVYYHHRQTQWQTRSMSEAEFAAIHVEKRDHMRPELEVLEQQDNEGA